MHHEFDACIIKEWGTRNIFFRGLLLSNDPRSSLLLIEVQRKLECLFGPTRFSVLRYASGSKAVGTWTEERVQGGEIRYHHSKLGNIYHVESQGNLVACLYLSPIDLRESIAQTLLDGRSEILSVTCPKFPPEFPDDTKHPGVI